MSDTGVPNSMQSNLRSSQSGMASFLVTMVLMVVITLIVLGFAQISRRNQREALDNQLSTQAFYAAETGVNLVQNIMQTATVVDKSTCPAAGTIYKQLSNATTNVYNSCLTVDTTPTSLRYDDVGSNSTVVPLKPTGTSNGTGTIFITWQGKSAGQLSSCPTAAPNAYGSFTPGTTSDWSSDCPYGVLRFDLVDFSAAAPAVTPLTLAQHTMTVFASPAAQHNALVPSSGYAGVVQPASATVPVKCDDNSCTAELDGVNLDDTNYLRLTSLYKDVAITSINGTNSHGTPISFVGAQVVVDSTGKAVDVLRRIEVRLDPNNQLAPAYAIQGTKGVCKLSSTTGGTNFSDSCRPY